MDFDVVYLYHQKRAGEVYADITEKSVDNILLC